LARPLIPSRLTAHTPLPLPVRPALILPALILPALILFILAAALPAARAQTPQLPTPTAADLPDDPATGSITGTVISRDGSVYEGVHVTLKPAIASTNPPAALEATTDSAGSFHFKAIPPGPFQITFTAGGFTTETRTGTLTPGNVYDLAAVTLGMSSSNSQIEITASREEIATEQLHIEEEQRVFGVIPNFYVAYGTQFVPLPTKLKYQLALRAATDTVTFASSLFLAGIDQAAATPNYVQGAKGYGQRVGAAYAGAASDVLIGGAILPSLLHQDPRYFYQGTGTNKSRALHAISAPFFCKGDDGRREFNYSSIGGDLLTGALSELYYPPSNRGPGLVFNSALVTTGGRIANALAQEFLLSKFTSRGKPHN